MSLANPLPERPQGCTNLKLRQLMRRVGAVFDQEMARSGLRGTQYSLLSHVIKLGPLRAVDLARAMKLSTSTLSRNLQPLVAAGWVQVRPGTDARSRLIVASEAGREKRKEAQAMWRVAQERVNAMLGPERVIALHALLDDSLLCLEEAGAPEGGDEE